jgi:hypothetical protein
MAFIPSSETPIPQKPINLDPQMLGYFLSTLGGAVTPENPYNQTVKKLATAGQEMAKAQQFGKLIQKLLAGGVTPKGAPGLDAISAGEDGSLTLKVPSIDFGPQLRGSLDTGKASQVQPGFLESLFQM